MAEKYILETCGLSHRFSDGDAVLHGLNLQVPEGSIYGFLGANGAGKTTTLRLVLGLLKVQQGTIRLFDECFTAQRLKILSQIGALIESPSLYSHLTAVENLQVLQKVYQCPVARIDYVLQQAGLADTGRKLVARFSLGMKQRLSIAMALLHEPSLLILDEPTNGLDPNGMMEIRELLLNLNRQHGITTVVSSHILAEIEKTVSHVGIIHRGRLLFQGTLTELQRERSAKQRLVLATGASERTFALLRAQGLDPVYDGHALSLVAPEPDRVATLVRDLVKAGIDVYEISPRRNDLEAIFMEMISEGGEAP
jgi:ABC-type multidrug transport system ATPase subunit